MVELKKQYDVVIVGAGPAGTSTAWACVDLGLDVLVLEKRQEIGAPKRCAEGLSDNSVKKLKLKIPKRCIAQEISGGVAIAPDGREIEVDFENTNGYVLERKVFDKWLAEKAAQSGATVMAGQEVSDLIFDKKIVKGVVLVDGTEIQSNIVVAADGVESKILRKVGFTSKQPKLMDSGYQYEMTNIELKYPEKITLFFGSYVAPRGYVWIFPKGKNRANVGIGINADNGKTAKEYLDKFIANSELKNGSILEVNAGAIPVGGLMKNMVSDGILGVGDSVNQVNPIHGGGIAEAIKAGRIAAEVIKEAHDSNDFSKQQLKSYNKIWWEQRGNSLKKVEKVREIFEKLSDDQMNNLVSTLEGEDLYDLAHGQNLPKLAKIFVKWKAKNLASALK